MRRFLLYHAGPEHTSYYGFDSDKSIDVLNDELKQAIATSARRKQIVNLQFLDIELTFFEKHEKVSIMTLDDFWDNSKKRDN